MQLDRDNALHAFVLPRAETSELQASLLATQQQMRSAETSHQSQLSSLQQQLYQAQADLKR